MSEHVPALWKYVRRCFFPSPSGPRGLPRRTGRTLRNGFPLPGPQESDRRRFRPTTLSRAPRRRPKEIPAPPNHNTPTSQGRGLWRDRPSPSGGFDTERTTPTRLGALPVVESRTTNPVVASGTPESPVGARGLRDRPWSSKPPRAPFGSTPGRQDPTPCPTQPSPRDSGSGLNGSSVADGNLGPGVSVDTRRRGPCVHGGKTVPKRLVNGPCRPLSPVLSNQ